MQKYICALLVFMLAVFTISCGGATSGKSLSEKATIKLNITGDDSQSGKAFTKTIGPDTIIASYTITGTGPEGATFTENTSESDAEVEVTAFGDWTIQVNAKNAAGIILQRGSQIATVRPADVTSVDIFLSAVDGYGTLDITVNWLDDISDPAIDAKLSHKAGAPISLSFSISGKTAACVNTSIPTGYYTLILKLKSGSTTSMGTVEVVSIINNATTIGVYNFNEINTEPSIDINIIQEEKDPLVVTLAGQSPEIDAGGFVTVTASVAGNPGDVSYAWYLNGDSKSTGSSYTVNGLNAGYYNLAVTAFAADGKRAGSASYSFKVTAPKTVYTGGDYFNGESIIVSGSSRSVMIPCYWKGSSKIDLVNESNIARVTSIFVNQGRVFCGGVFTSNTGSNACYWDGITKINLDREGQENLVNSIYVYDGTVYCGGYNSVGPCYWTGSSLTNLPLKTPWGGWVASIYVSNGAVYSGGVTTTTSSDPHLYGACYWIDGQRTDLSNQGRVHSICVYNNIVYTGGHSYNESTGSSSPCYWTGITRTNLPGEGDQSGWVTSIFVYNGEVYSAGHYYNKNGRRIPCYWVGTARTDLTDDSYIATVNSIYVSDGKIYIGGNYSNSSKTQPCYWTITATGITKTDLQGDGIHAADGSSIFVE